MKIFLSMKHKKVEKAWKNILDGAIIDIFEVFLMLSLFSQFF